MLVIAIQVSGVLVFVAGTIWLARRVRMSSDSELAGTASRMSHGLFWIALVLPGVVGFFQPGLTAYDDLLGVPALPASPVWTVAGIALLAAGLLLMAGSNRFLIKRGRGAAAFLLTEKLVTDGLYGRTRNPMSLGFYAACLGAGLVAGSTTVTLGVLLIVVPAHAFNLRYFEERELELRYGAPYADYKRQVPFLIPRLRHTPR